MIFNKGARRHSMGEKTVFSTNGAGTTGYAHEARPLPNTLYKNGPRT